LTAVFTRFYLKVEGFALVASLVARARTNLRRRRFDSLWLVNWLTRDLELGCRFVVGELIPPVAGTEQ